MILTKPKRDFLIIFIGKLFQIIVAILTIKVSTALLDPKEMGNIYIFTTLYTFFVFVLISPFGQYINRHTHKWLGDKTLINNLIIYGIYVFFVSITSVFIGYIIYEVGIISGIKLSLFSLLLFLFITCITLNQTVIPMLNMLHYRLYFTILTVLTAIGVLLFGYIFVLLFGDSATNWLFGLVLANALFLLLGFIVLKNKIQGEFKGFTWNYHRITKGKIKTILYFVVPLSIATVLMWLQNSGYRIIIEKAKGLEFLGYFGVGMAISAQIASIVESVVMQYFHPIYYQQITNTSLESRKKAIDELINKVLPIYLMLAIFVTFFAKYIIEIVVAEKYYEAYIFTIFGIWIEFFRMTSNLFGNISQSELNTKKFMIPYAFGSFVTIGLVYLSGSTQEYKIYLSMSLLVGAFTTMLTMYFFMKRLIDFTIRYKSLLFSFLLSLPYSSILFFDIRSSIFDNLLVVIIFGLYFLGAIFFMYRKNLEKLEIIIE